MTKLQKATGNEQLLALKAAYNHQRNVNNLYLMNEWLQSPEAYQAIVYQDLGNGMAAFRDEGDFYRVVFALPVGSCYHFPPLDKELCCDLVEIGGEAAPAKEYGEDFLFDNGFSLIDCQKQLRFCCGSQHRQAVKKEESILRQLRAMHLQYINAGRGELEEIRRLIRRELGRYDAVLLNERELEAEAQKNNIVCIKGTNGIAAAYFFQAAGGRIVVAPAYRGKRLSEMLRMLFIAQERWLNSRENQYDWVGADNTPSLRCLFSIGAVATGKVKKRFIRTVES